LEINGKAPLFTPPPATPIKDDTRGAMASPTDTTPKDQDTVDLSTNANEISEMVQKINDFPDVREEKVAELKRRIASGTYRIMNEQAASRLIGETVENNAILNHIDTLDD
jgi:flagellar biosynthesis anti-sigma factor FlgM